MLLRKSAKRAAGAFARTVGRREFLKRSGIAAGGTALASQLPFTIIERTEAAADLVREGRNRVLGPSGHRDYVR